LRSKPLGVEGSPWNKNRVEEEERVIADGLKVPVAEAWVTPGSARSNRYVLVVHRVELRIGVRSSMSALFWSLLLAGVVIALWLFVVWFEHRDNARKRRKGDR
jgi:hypothetical protein